MGVHSEDNNLINMILNNSPGLSGFCLQRSPQNHCKTRYEMKQYQLKMAFFISEQEGTHITIYLLEARENILENEIDIY